MQSSLFSLILVFIGALAGSTVFVSWIDTVETIEKNVIVMYLVVPDNSAIPEAEFQEQLVQTIKERLALTDSVATTTEVEIEFVGSKEEENEISSIADTSLSAHIAVPFTSQAPFGIWTQPWQDACEEASVIMAHAYISNISLSPSYVESEVYKLIEYEKRALGYFNDTNVADTALFARTQYGLETRIIDNPTVADITKQLNLGNIVIAPMAGRLLPNPYFTPPGPLYHMLVIIGYDKAAKQFITNDPGTRRGASLRYSYDSLMYALHDWTGVKETINSGAKRILVIET